MKRSLLPVLFLLASCATTPKPVAEPAPQPKPTPAPRAAQAVPVAPRPFAPTPPLHVVSQSSPHKQVVSVRLVFRGGSVNDPQGKEGLTALTTELMAEGGTVKLSASELREALYPMAAELSASTGKELIVFSARVHKERVTRLLEVLTDVLLEPRFDPKEFERLRSDAQSEVENALRGENDEELGKRALDALLYPGHPYRHPEVGTVRGLKAITLDDVRAQWKALFTQDRLIIGLAGPVDEKLVEQVRTRLAKLPAQGLPQSPLPPAPGPTQKALLVQKGALSTAASLGYSWPLHRGHPDFPAVAFATSYLGEHRQFHGVLFQELREKRGLNYGTYAYAEHFRQQGWSAIPQVNVARSIQDFTIWIRPVEPANGVFAVRGAVHFLRKLLAAPLDKERLEATRGFLIGYTRVWEQTDQRRLGYAIDDLLYGTPNFLESYRKALATLTAEQVQQAALRHLSPDRLNFALVAQDTSALATQLRDQPPSPIRYPSPKPKDVLEEDLAIAVEALPVHPSSLETVPARTFMEQ